MATRPAPAVSVRTGDVRFLLPSVPRTAAVVGAGEGWTEALAAAGVEVRAADGDADVDVVVASPEEVNGARHRAPFVIVDGRARDGTPVFVLPAGGAGVALTVPGPGVAAAIAANRGGSAAHRLRNRMVAAGARRGVAPRRLAPITLLPRLGRPPAFVAAATSLGADGVGWYLLPGRDDPRSKSVFLTVDGRGVLQHVVKFQRTAGAAAQLDRGEQGLAVAAAGGPVVASRAPKLVGRTEVDGHPVLVETALPGRPLANVIGQPAALGAIHAVGRWLGEVAEATARAGSGPEDDRDRLGAARAAWPAGAVPFDDSLVEQAPGVLVHGDLWEENVFVEGGEIAVVDWDGARRSALPLWDTLYFGLQVLPLVDGARAQRERAVLAMALLDGSAPSAPLLRSWVSAQVESLALPDELPGAVLTLCLLDLLVRTAPDAPAWFLPDVARQWVARGDWRWSWRG